MAKFKVAISGYMLLDIEADSAEAAEEKVYEDDRAGELYNLEILETVPAEQPLKFYTDLE